MDPSQHDEHHPGPRSDDDSDLEGPAASSSGGGPDDRLRPPSHPHPHLPARGTLAARLGALFSRRRLRPALIVAGGLAGVAVLATTAWFATLFVTTPDPSALGEARNARPSVVVAADGTVLATFRRTQLEPVTLDQVAPAVVTALIDTEDHRFLDHPGIDLRRTVAAMWHTLRGHTQGGSTLTQQLARNLFPKEIGRARSAERKLREIVTALRIERAYGKREILEAYLNTAPFLYNVVGIEMAARTYFDKPAAALDIRESATLVGMLKGTQYYNPVRFPERALKRRNVVLAQMAKRGHLPAAQQQALAAQPLQLAFRRPMEDAGPAPHFAAQVRRQMLDWADERDHDLYTEGLVIETTLDMRLQQAAARVVERQAAALQKVADVEWSRPSVTLAHSLESYAARHAKAEPFRHFWQSRPELQADFLRESADYRKLREAGRDDAAALRALQADAAFLGRLRADKTRLEAGFTAIDPASGDVKAWVGSRDFEVDQFDHVGQAQRQPGSTFKPFVYGAALAAGIEPWRTYTDGPVRVPLSDGTLWEPTDMGGSTGLPMTMHEGLVLSKNTITAQVAQEVGVESVVRLARAAGVETSRLDAVPSLALGTSPVTLLEMVSGYATIAHLGEWRKPMMVRRVKDREGKLLAEFGETPRRAFAEDTARDLLDMLRGVVTRGTGAAVKAKFNLHAADVAGKTGTTQNNTDGWFILMHPQLVAGAWVGFNDQRVTMRSDHWGMGGSNALLLVGDFFREALKVKAVDVKAKFPPPARPMPPPAPASEPQWIVPSPEGLLESEPPAAGGSGTGALRSSGNVVVGRDANGRVVIGDRIGVESLQRLPATPIEPVYGESVPPIPGADPLSAPR